MLSSVDIDDLNRIDYCIGVAVVVVVDTRSVHLHNAFGSVAAGEWVVVDEWVAVADTSVVCQRLVVELHSVRALPVRFDATHSPWVVAVVVHTHSTPAQDYCFVD